MRNNLKNELWKSNPHDAKIAFEKELRELMKAKADWGKKMCSPEEPQYSKVWGQHDLIKEILGDA